MISPILNLRNNSLTVASGFETIDRTKVTILKVIQTGKLRSCNLTKLEEHPGVLVRTKSRPLVPDSATETGPKLPTLYQ